MIYKLKIPDVIKRNFRSSTLNFIFIIAYVNIFQYFFGPENSITGVIFTIMMSASMVRDFTAAPMKHLVVQALVLVWMALAAYWVTTFSGLLPVFINFITILVILYAFTYEYSSHMYFPYILSYLFLIFISPVNSQQLPNRILGMLAGAVSIILYQWFMGRKRVAETARDVLSEMIDDICLFISCRLNGIPEQPDIPYIHRKLCRLSQSVYERRKKVLCISDAGFSMVDAGRALEHLLLLIHELPKELSECEKESLLHIAGQLKIFHDFLQEKIPSLPPVKPLSSFPLENQKNARLFYHTLYYIRDRIIHMTVPQGKVDYRKTALSLKIRLQAALDLSPVRAVYAVRAALLLSAATWFVQSLSLTHGKWLLLTLASVSLPYADDVPLKMKKRTLATMIGGLASVIIYTLIPSAEGRTVVMMLSGYISFYFSDYTETFACSTIGALGGAVFMDTFGLQAVSQIVLIRLGYILAGIMLGYIANCLIFPFSRAKATRQLWDKYNSVTNLLKSVCHSDQTDTQLYYNLVIQAHLLEEKLSQNALLENWSEFPKLLEKCREQIRMAHRTRIAERADAPIFEPGHLS